jgi:hypothetical protein
VLPSSLWLAVGLTLLAVLAIGVLLVVIRSRHPVIFRLILRPIAIFIGLFGVAFGLVVIYLADRPSPLGDAPSIDVSYSCPKHESLMVLQIPTIEITAENDNTFSGTFLAGLASQGSAPECTVQLTLPNGSHYSLGPVPPGNTSGVAVGVIPSYSSEINQKEDFDYTFYSSQRSTWPDGLARREFDLNISTGEHGESLPTVTPAGAPARSLELRATCPGNFQEATNAYPGSAEFLGADQVSWPVESGYPSAFTVICENSNNRFWVDHATDAVVLGIGLLLSVMVERRNQERSERAESGSSRAQQEPARDNGDTDAKQDHIP